MKNSLQSKTTVESDVLKNKLLNTVSSSTVIDEDGFPTASLENLYRIFTVSEEPDSTLGAIDREITENLAGFLRDRIVAREKALGDIEADFSAVEIPEEPQFVSEYTEFVMDKLVAHSVHATSPSFIGHMAMPLPYFMLPLSRIMVALNQNLVKIETSKAFTPLERQVLGMVHELVYSESDQFYQNNLHNSRQALGAFCSGGTVANVTALWAARNQIFPATDKFKGVAQEGIASALMHSGHKGIAVLVSRRGHYSLGKAVDLLGIGRANLISIDTDEHHKIDIQQLKAKCDELTAQGIKIMAIVGIAGATETGSVDPLDQMAEIAKQYQTYFHVDAAWGGPTLLSNKYKSILKGIEQADSVTIDAHKQLYVPMGAGMVVFKSPSTLNIIEHHAEYILRAGSKDLGQYSLEGSRSGMAMLVHAAFHIIGRKGYELLMNRNIEITRKFAEMIKADPDFELLSEPELNILNYRYVPKATQEKLQLVDEAEQIRINQNLDTLTKLIQKVQRQTGKSFVSRTRFMNYKYNKQKLSSFRVVLSNPMTTLETLEAILDEQRELVEANASDEVLSQLLR